MMPFAQDILVIYLATLQYCGRKIKYRNVCVCVCVPCIPKVKMTLSNGCVHSSGTHHLKLAKDKHQRWLWFSLRHKALK